MASSDLTQAQWFKSSYSNGSGECVEVAFVGGAVAMRDSKDPDGPALTFAPGEFGAFVRCLGGGELHKS